MKHADNVLKGFATSISTVFVTVACALIPAFSFSPTPAFVLGAIMVLGSAYSYGRTVLITNSSSSSNNNSPAAPAEGLKPKYPSDTMVGWVGKVVPDLMALMRALAAVLVVLDLSVWLLQ